jgi:hypothetical protein
MSGAAHDEPPAAARPERRTSQRRVADRRRTYNRRAEDREVSPPYFEIFERIAIALEQIAVTANSGRVTLPDVHARPPADQP